jgi:hypothetical protein
MSMHKLLAASAAVAAMSLSSLAALADDHPYTQGPVVNVAYIRTEYGKTEDYLKYLANTWKPEQEAAKKAGLILSYRVITVEPRTENDADIVLVINYKNWAALDTLQADEEAIEKKIEGSLSVSNQGAVDRGKIRRVLGSWTGQELDFK